MYLCFYHILLLITGRTQPDLSDKPSIPSPKKIWSAKVVSDAELEETQKNYDQLKFDIETLVSIVYIQDKSNLQMKVIYQEQA